CGEAGGERPHQSGGGGASAPAARPAHSGHESPHGVFRQSRHGKDHHRPADGTGLPQPGHLVQGAAGGGRPQRAGGGLRGTDSHQDPEGHRLRSGGCAVHRRGIRPQ
ncbi:plasmid mobilization relaxosome protein MobC, partial [Dysosmobacter welbionis]